MKKNFLIGVIVVIVILAAGSIAYIHGKNSSLTSAQNNTNSVANNSSVLENNTTNSANNSSSASNNSSTGTGNYSSKNNSNSVNPNSSNVNNGAASSNNSSSANMNAANSTNNTANNTGNAKGYEAYFGKWKITKSVGTLHIYAMSNDDIKSYIGKTITISKNEFADTNGSVQSPRYEVKTVSGSEFFDETKIKLNAIGVNGDSIRELTIYNPEGKVYNMIYLLDNNTIVYLWDGVFFQGEK